MTDWDASCRYRTLAPLQTPVCINPRVLHNVLTHKPTRHGDDVIGCTDAANVSTMHCPFKGTRCMLTGEDDSALGGGYLI